MELLRKLCRRYTKSYLEFSGKVETTIEDSVFTACCVQLWFCTIWWLDIKWAWAEPSQNPPWTISLGDSRANNWALQMVVSETRCKLWQREKIIVRADFWAPSECCFTTVCWSQWGISLFTVDILILSSPFLSRMLFYWFLMINNECLTISEWLIRNTGRTCFKHRIALKRVF